MNSSQSILIRNYTPQDLVQVREINYVTGLMGKSLSELNLFNDKKLFNMLFIDYYIKYELENCFVAIDRTTQTVVGYIIGTEDTQKQEKKFRNKMGWRIFLRLFFITWWRHPESFRQFFHFLNAFPEEHHQAMKKIIQDFPAHLHVNMFPAMQSKGGGSMLLFHFLKHLRSQNIKGLHLGTMNQNIKAIPFYQKHGFQLAKQTDVVFWTVESKQISLTYTKIIEERKAS